MEPRLLGRVIGAVYLLPFLFSCGAACSALN